MQDPTSAEIGTHNASMVEDKSVCSLQFFRSRKNPIIVQGDFWAYSVDILVFSKSNRFRVGIFWFLFINWSIFSVNCS